MKVKFNPTRGSTDAIGKVSFPGSQEVFDFVSAGSESSVTATVAGDTDVEYLVYVRNFDADDGIKLVLNADTNTNYGIQQLANVGGSLSATRAVDSDRSLYVGPLGIAFGRLFTTSGLTKIMLQTDIRPSAATTVNVVAFQARVWNSTSNVTSMVFSIASGNFTSGTQFTIYARRSQA